jgi:hypothetical protein
LFNSRFVTFDLGLEATIGVLAEAALTCTYSGEGVREGKGPYKGVGPGPGCLLSLSCARGEEGGRDLIACRQDTYANRGPWISSSCVSPLSHSLFRLFDERGFFPYSRYLT